ncbi:hypothetical protein [Pseudomonas sp. Z2-11]
MSVNSLESLLSHMNGVSVCHGWGAIAVFGRAQLNRLLETQYLAWLNESRQLPPLSGEFDVTDDGTESVTLDSLVLGKPVLSFESASLNSHRVTLTMNIIAGTYSAMSRPVLGVPGLMSSFSISEDLGFKVEMKIDLDQLEGEVDKKGRITLDLASDPEMTCNLGSLPGVQKKIGAFIQGLLAVQPVDKRTFELGLFNFSGYNPLSPTGYYLSTQKAPGAENPLAPNHGDGAVVVFIRLKVSDENGSIPGEGSGFPYLIPDDQVDGEDLYSASLVLNHDWIDLLNETQLDVLKNLLFPGENVFIESTDGKHEPHDFLVLGNIKPTPESMTIEPPFISLRGEKTQQFTARAGDGSVINDVQWSVSNPISPLSVGTITQEGGVYTSLSQSKMGKEQLPTVVTAGYSMEDRKRISSALVLSVFESMSISPRVCTSGIGTGATPIQLSATTLSGGDLVWPTLTPAEGLLTVMDNNHAVYKPPISLAEPLVVQKIRVLDKSTRETIEATIVLLKSQQTLAIDPPFVPSISLSETVQLRADWEWPEDCVWSVIGEGEVSQEGVFTPPAQMTSLFTVVKCTAPRGRSGYSIIQLSERQEAEPRWSELDEFSIIANGGQDQCYSNGLQQIPVIITIKTKSINMGGEEIYIPVSDVELSTLRLVDKLTGAEVPFTRLAQEGIEYDSGIQWAVNKKRNRFKYYSPAGIGQTPALAPPVAKNNGVRFREFYIHLATAESRTFFARFQAADGSTHNSTDNSNENYEITVKGIRPTPPTIRDYEFVRDRAFQDSAGHDEPGNPEPDYFSYYLKSTDYWRLSYRRQGIYPVGFATLLIEKNISTIQWESELLDEMFFSYTGYAFRPANYDNSDSLAPDGLSFDLYFWRLTRGYAKTLKTSFEGDKQPAPGELIVSLHRTDDMKYWHDGMANGDEHKFYRKLLDLGVIFVLLDEDGNRHKVKISFEASSRTDSRNILILSLV